MSTRNQFTDRWEPIKVTSPATSELTSLHLLGSESFLRKYNWRIWRIWKRDANLRVIVQSSEIPNLKEFTCRIQFLSSSQVTIHLPWRTWLKLTTSLINLANPYSNPVHLISPHNLKNGGGVVRQKAFGSSHRIWVMYHQGQLISPRLKLRSHPSQGSARLSPSEIKVTSLARLKAHFPDSSNSIPILYHVNRRSV